MLLLLLCLTTLGMTAAKVNKSINIQVNGVTRSFWLYVPNSYKSQAPLVVALHGAGGTSSQNSPGFNAIADKEGFIVVYPQGEEIFFPVFGSSVNGWHATGDEESDGDVAFIKAVIAKVDESYVIDHKRIYCCGFSNGGMMTYSLANTCSDVFAAFASISGFPLNEFHLHHTGARPVPFLHIHGKQDDFVKYSLMPVIVDEMVARMGANPIPVTTGVTGKYKKSVYEAMDGSFPFVYYEVDNMSHNDFTTDTEDGNSSLTMWNFFKQYTLDTPCDTLLKWRPRTETEGFVPSKHGWTYNAGTYLMVFGKQQKTDANQNVYHSLQFTTGTYKLCFQSTGSEGQTVTAKLQKLTGNKKVVLNQTVPAGQPAQLLFTVDDGWAEYRLTVTRSAATDEITVSNMAIYTVTAEDLVGISQPQTNNAATIAVYSPTGIRTNQLRPGVNIVRTSNGDVRKILE